MDDDLKRLVEAILFAAGRKLELSEIAKLCKKTEAEVSAVLNEWKSLLASSEGPTMLVEDGTGWKLTVREKYVTVIKKVVTKTELPKGHLETLAVVAYKAPVLQSKVIKLRTNKAYDHLNQLEESGLIVREKSGRTKLIKLTPKFFEYFDIDPSKLRQKFSSSGDVEKAIEAKESEIAQSEVEQRKVAGERLEKAEIVLHPDSGPARSLETYPVVQPVEELLPTGVEVVEEKVGDLPVYDVPLESIPVDERPVEEHAHKKHHKKVHKKHSHEVHHKVEGKVEAPVTSELAKEVETAVEEVREEAAELEGVPVAKHERKHKEKVVPVEEIPKVEEKSEEKVDVPLTHEQKIAKEAADKTSRMKQKSFEEGKGLYPKGVPPEMEAKIEEKIKRLLSGEPEEKEE